MQAYFARQPIMDANLKLYAYELLYRSGPQADSAGALLDGDRATAAVMEAFQTLGISKITGGKKAFVNFSRKLLLDGVAVFFSPEQLVVEILEDIEPTPEVVDAIADLKGRGFMIALDDFEYKPDLQPFVDLADIIKIDFLNGIFSEQNIRNIVKHADLKKTILLAEKVESREDFERAYHYGCRLFQGYFFAKPSNMSEPILNMSRINCLRLLTEVNRDSIDFHVVAKIIKSDISLSFRVLKLVNSSYFGLRQEVSDILQAVVILGVAELKKWVSFVSLSDVSMGQPSEIIMMSMARARFCELLAGTIGKKADADAFFLAGMFSLLDVLMGCDLEAVLHEVKIPDITRDALLGENNAGRYTLDLIITLERGDWDNSTAACEKLRLDRSKASDLYIEALRWANELGYA